MQLKAVSEKSLNQNTNNRNKPKFCVKILRLLKETLNDEKKIPDIGLSWCEDGTHFVCNSQILGNYLNLKSNSINTNFRAHSFQIENINFDDLQKMFGNLPDLKNWKMRRAINYSFNYKSTEADAEKIPCSEKTNRTLDIVSIASNSMLPQITRDILQNNKLIISQIEPLMAQVDFTLDWKNAFLNLISTDWCNIIGSHNNSNNYESISTSNLINAIINGADPPIDPNLLQYIEVNLEYLLKNSKCNSQSPDKVFFFEYLKLCLRYGVLSRIAHTILELSSQSGFYFASWFIPTTDQQYAIDSMTRNNLKWILKLSKSHPNVFTILLSSKNSEIKSSHITFNPMPMKAESTLSIKKEGVQSMISRASFHEFIVDVLGFEIPLDRPEEREFKNVKHVSLNELVIPDNNSQNRIQENNIPLMSDFDLIHQPSMNGSQNSQSNDLLGFSFNWETEYNGRNGLSPMSGISHDLNFSPTIPTGIVPDLTLSQTSQGIM